MKWNHNDREWLQITFYIKFYNHKSILNGVNQDELTI